MIHDVTSVKYNKENKIFSQKLTCFPRFNKKCKCGGRRFNLKPDILTWQAVLGFMPRHPGFSTRYSKVKIDIFLVL